MKIEVKKIISSAWVVPVGDPVIHDGSLVIVDDRIIDSGQREEILAKYPGIEESRYPAVLIPGLVNGHIHLELAHLNTIPELLPHHTFTDWIGAVLAQRAENASTMEQRRAAYSALLHDQYASGVVFLADTGNEFLSELHSPAKEGWPKIERMLEYLGPDRQTCRIAREKIGDLDDRIAATGHAPYSTAPELLQYIKNRCRRLHRIFSIHTAESAAELQFLQSNRGIFRDFLEKRNRWDGTFSFDRMQFSGTIEYYDHLGIVDDMTLLVHCVHVSENELVTIAERGGHVCLCPGSNRFLKVGLPPVAKMLEVGILPALGTDSPASNPLIDLWNEMRLLAEDHPAIDHERIFAMATLGGAQALHVDEDYGSLAIGKKARLLHVSSPALLQCRSGRDVMRELVAGGRPAEISWV
jgi:cytosine/adenosine deaminase-related metal-dependent hydrolase